MEKTVESFFLENHIEGLHMVSARMMGMRIFDINTPYIELRGNDYPLVDKTLGLVFLINGGHKHLASALGRLHLSKVDSHGLLHSEEFVHFFLRCHGYYWSGAHLSQSYAHIVTSKDFKFTDVDTAIRYALGFDHSLEDYPFD